MDLQAIRTWLTGWPLWKEGMPLYVEYTDTDRVCGGLFPLGTEELDTKTDVLGNTTVTGRFRFELRTVLPYPDEDGENAAWLQALQEWVQQQSLAGFAPRFGDFPETERVRAEKGLLTQLRKQGKVMHTVSFTADFTKFYEVIE